MILSGFQLPFYKGNSIIKWHFQEMELGNEDEKLLRNEGWKMKKGKVLVTGSGGFNGRYILELLKQNGYEVRATDLPAGERTSLPEYYEQLGVEFVPADLTDSSTLGPVLEGIDYVMHVASLFDYSAPLELDRKINVGGMRNLCEASRKAGIKKMVLWGTIGVYGVQKDNHITEEMTPNPGNAYEISKLEQEQVALEYSKKGDFAVTIMRPSPVYGPGNRYGFINMIKMACMLPQVPVPLQIQTRLPSVHVRDVAAIGLFLLEAPDKKTDGEVFTVVDDSNIPLPEFLFLIGGLLGKETIKIGLPMHMPTILTLGHFAAGVVKFVTSKISDKRPFLEDDTIYYMQFSNIYSNEKLKKLGYKFIYPDFRVGLIEMTDWIKSENMEPLKIW